MQLNNQLVDTTCRYLLQLQRQSRIKMRRDGKKATPLVGLVLLVLYARLVGPVPCADAAGSRREKNVLLLTLRHRKEIGTNIVRGCRLQQARAHGAAVANRGVPAERKRSSAWQARRLVLRGGTEPVDPLEAETGDQPARFECSPSPELQSDSVWMPVIPSPLRDQDWQESSSQHEGGGGREGGGQIAQMENASFVQEEEEEGDSYSSGMGNPGSDTVWMPDNFTSVPRAMRKVCGMMLRFVEWPPCDEDGIFNPPINQFGEPELIECKHEWEEGTGQKLRVRAGADAKRAVSKEPWH